MATFIYKKIGTQNADFTTSEGEFSLVDGEIILDYGFSFLDALALVLETVLTVSYIGEERSWTSKHYKDYFVEIHRKEESNKIGAFLDARYE
jgi:hypothetical protein